MVHSRKTNGLFFCALLYTYVVFPQNANGGPQEIVTRHPVHRGWILYSEGTVWTQFPHPKRGKSSGICNDPLLREYNLSNLPSEIDKHY